MDLISREKATRYLAKARMIGDDRPMSDICSEIPSAFEGKTNGGVLISLYPNLKYTIQNGRVVTTIGVASSFDLEWWNAPYKGVSE